MTVVLPISPTQSTIQAALAAFLSEVLPGPFSGDAPAVFSGWIAGAVLTVNSLIEGTIEVFSPILGAAPGTVILSQTSGTAGDIGTYTVSVSQTLGSPPTGVTMATGVDIISGQPNRAAEPANPFFVVMTPIRFERLATNVDIVQDVKLTGSIAGNVLTVIDILTGDLVIGATIFGEGVIPGTQIVGLAGGETATEFSDDFSDDFAHGGFPYYILSNSQTIPIQTLSAGWKTLTQDARSTVQCDFHTSDTTAGDLAQTVSTALRDEFGVNVFSALSSPLSQVVPLYADDPAQRPFVNAENQYEWRYSLDVHLEARQSIQVPQTFADSVDPTLVNVDAAWPI
jgi:hypothetical protein